VEYSYINHSMTVKVNTDRLPPVAHFSLYVDMLQEYYYPVISFFDQIHFLIINLSKTY